MMKDLSQTVTLIHFSPSLDQEWLIALAVLALLLFAVSFVQKHNGLVWRGLVLSGFFLALLNPSLLKKQREPVKNTAVIVVDDSMSQSMKERMARTEEALEHIKDAMHGFDAIELRVVRAPEDAALSTETRLFSALEREFADVPQNRRAGAVLITDGQVHDVPLAADYGPIHTLLSGERGERDRRIDIVENPSYGIVGEAVNISYTVTQTSNIRRDYAMVTLNRFDGNPEVFSVPVGEEQHVSLSLDHAGENIFELSVAAVSNEITEANNRTAVRVNGVRDRLKVLLVSGRPHAGGRTWRDLLTSDPGVDLVHFTILREPEKLDATPQRELALIAFPFRELF